MTERHNNDNFPCYEKIKSILNKSPDLMCRKLEVGQKRIHIIFMKNLIKPEILNEYVILTEKKKRPV
ncbi:hypothetical protein [Globicatella sulfidifaciens]|uniref:hypothetical protein n=1 Tax=Globicatella sulfidifaciens TaxID=136093 RepID=UPI0023F3A2A0|nr:hypothetical protein [Globicatella sulfidifaciens]